MNLVVAGLDLLYGIMCSDNRIDEGEIREIVRFLVRGMDGPRETRSAGRPGLTDILMEVGLLSALGAAELEERIRDSAGFFRQCATARQKKALLDFARGIAMADGRVMPEEAGALGNLERMLTAPAGRPSRTGRKQGGRECFA